MCLVAHRLVIISLRLRFCVYIVFGFGFSLLCLDARKWSYRVKRFSIRNEFVVIALRCVALGSDV